MKQKVRIPPESLIFVGDGDFIKIGERFCNFLIDLAGLQRNHHVLDAGCGIGRIAIPLTKYLLANGEYWGFDIVKSGINWCLQHISSVFPNFHFFPCDVYNKHYNKTGTIPAREYKFPFENDIFDVVFLASVFTHMLPEDVSHYFAEISRLLKPGGKCLITFFILNETSEKSIQNGDSRIDFRHRFPEYMTSDENNRNQQLLMPNLSLQNRLVEMA